MTIICLAILFLSAAVALGVVECYERGKFDAKIDQRVIWASQRRVK